jgi:predicted NAD/FAD-dependent oxidoreductase
MEISPMTESKLIAIIGAGMAGVACARTLVQAGHRVTVFEKNSQPGGRMATHLTEFGGFDAGTQYFTVRDPRFARALETVPGLCRPWSANTVRVLDAHGRVAVAAPPPHESHWVPVPGMDALVRRWAEPLQQTQQLELDTRVTRIERDALHPQRWQLHTEGPQQTQHVFSGFDAVLLALPAARAQALLHASRQAEALAKKISAVQVAPCWTLLLAFPQAVQPGLTTLGPQWNAARSTHHRIAWLARESSKPGRDIIERWTVQASPAWSQEHLQDDAARVQAKLLKAFAEITGIHAEPSYAVAHRWPHAQTTRALGTSHLWDAKTHIGVCGDWCTGHRVEDAFLSGLELALKIC